MTTSRRKAPASGKESGSAATFLPHHVSLTSLKTAAKWCRGCELYRNATHVVFGEGSESASLVLVGEQPGDVEDRNGLPFVGPSGQLLRKAVAEAGIDYAEIYVTNAVKHFFWRPQGKRRLHQTPRPEHVKACRPWLDAELTLLKPEVLVCLGATATRAVMGKPATIASLRGRFVESPYAALTLVTVHPSSLLRIPDPEARRAAYEAYVADFRLAAGALHGGRLPKAG